MSVTLIATNDKPKPFGWAVQVNGLFAHIHKEGDRERIHRGSSLQGHNLFEDRDDAVSVVDLAKRATEGFQQIILLEIREDPEQPI